MLVERTLSDIVPTLCMCKYNPCVNTIPFKASSPHTTQRKLWILKWINRFVEKNEIHTPHLIKPTFHEYVLQLYFFNNRLIKAILNVNSESRFQMYVEIQNWKLRSKHLRILCFLWKQMYSWTLRLYLLTLFLKNK